MSVTTVIGDTEHVNPTGPGWDMEELAKKKAAESAAYWNERNDEFFLTKSIPNWVKGVTENGNKWPLPLSPPIYIGKAEKQLFGWQPVLENTGPKYTNVDILLMLDLEYQKVNSTVKSLWDMVAPEIRALCGLDNPDTPGKFGPRVGALPGCFWLAPDDLPVPDNGTRRTVDGIVYELTGGFIKYWKPVA